MKRNYSRFYALLGRMPTIDKDELKIGLVRQYTDNRTESLKEMTDKEYDAMCDGMQRQSNGYKAREIAREELRRKRSAALHLLQKHGICQFHCAVQVYVPQKGNAFFRNRGIRRFARLIFPFQRLFR